MDNIFGSTGGQKINDVIALYDAEHGPAPDPVDSPGETTSTAKLPREGVLYANADRPNFFIAIRCDQPSLVQAAAHVQERVVAYEPRLASACLPHDAFHLTLLTLRLDTQEEVTRACEVLASCQAFLANLLPHQQPVALQGLSCFRDRVLVANVAHADQLILDTLAGHLLAQCRAAGLRTPGNHREFVAHMTLVKMSRQLCRDLRRLPEPAFTALLNTDFGLQRVEELHLCHMTSAKGLDGFYLREARLVNTSAVMQQEAAVQTICRPGKMPQIPTVVILRGLPGSGKSCLVHAFADRAVVCSADAYFAQAPGGYAFNKDQLPAAHQACWQQFVRYTQADRSPLVLVDNTNSTLREFQGYIQLAHEQGFDVRVLEIACPTRTHFSTFVARCQHSVPLAVMETMRARWQPYSEALMVEPWLELDQPVRHATSTVGLSVVAPPAAIPTVTVESGCYSAIFLTPESRAALLVAIPPVHATVLADHMTLLYKPSVLELGALPVGLSVQISVLGAAQDAQGQAVMVRVLSDDLSLQSTNLNPHVTVSTAAGISAAYSNTLLLGVSAAQLARPREALVLEGLVGVEIDRQRILSPEKLQQCLQEQLHLAPQSENSTAIEAVTSLFVFDFDLTLFETCGPKEGQAIYRQFAGVPWPYRGWLTVPASLQPPIPIRPGPVLPLFRRFCGRASSHTVVLSGRTEALRPQFLDVFVRFDLPQPDEVILKPDKDMETPAFKLECLSQLLRRFPNLRQLHVWDDNRSNLVAFAAFQRQLTNGPFRSVRMKVTDSHEVAAKTCLGPAACADRLVQKLSLDYGWLRSDAFTRAANEGLQLLHVTWRQTLVQLGHAVPLLSSNLMLTFGSFELARASDVDLCLLAPLQLNQWECILKLEEQLHRRGLAYTYAATQSRCPRLKVRLFFERMHSIEYDILFVLVPGEKLVQVPVDVRARLSFMQKHMSDHMSQIAVQGCAFLGNCKDRLATAGVKVQALALTVEFLRAMFRAHGLIGSEHHALRTYHVVQFVISCLPLEISGSIPLTPETWVVVCIRRLGALSSAEWQAAVDGSVAPQWLILASSVMQAACELLGTGSGITRVTLERLLEPPPTPRHTVRVDVHASSMHAVLMWQLSTFLAGRMSAYVRKLMDLGHTVRACDRHTGSLASFYLLMAGTAEDAAQLVFSVLQPFWGELNVYRQVGVTMSITTTPPSDISGEIDVAAVSPTATVIFSDCAADTLATRLTARTCQVYVQQLEDFASAIDSTEATAARASQQKRLEFPATLTSAQRWVIHQRAQELGLTSYSQGVGRQRYLAVESIKTKPT